MRANFKTYALVLKRVKLGETDQIIHFLSLAQGNFSAVAKGSRKLNSKKLGSLEPGSLVEAYFVKTQGLPILTQLGRGSQPIDMDQLDLKQMRSLFQLLEVFDRLFVGQALDQASFDQVLKLRQLVLDQPQQRKQLQQQLGNLVANLGFQHPQDTKFTNLSSYIEALTERELKSSRFLTVK